MIRFGYGDPSPDAVLDLFREILAINDQDGVHFDVAAVRIDRIREEIQYGGVRIRTIAEIGGAQVPVSVDVGFGDTTEPGAEDLEFPVMLDMALTARLSFEFRASIAFVTGMRTAVPRSLLRLNLLRSMVRPSGTEAPGARMCGETDLYVSFELEFVAGRLCDSPGCAEMNTTGDNQTFNASQSSCCSQPRDYLMCSKVYFLT